MTRWDFRWSAVSGASSYNLYVIGPNASSPTIDDQNITALSFHYESHLYVPDANRLGWHWEFRVQTDGLWGPLGAERTFDVEPQMADCPDIPR